MPYCRGTILLDSDSVDSNDRSLSVFEACLTGELC